mmetsp:Transcript_4170/g.9857  ORF Transcript_4170/g.9857 Transcript_4170/m.9857 type:complete len:450 (-) Transcript_4170:170-1519(-)
MRFRSSLWTNFAFSLSVVAGYGVVRPDTIAFPDFVRIEVFTVMAILAVLYVVEANLVSTARHSIECRSMQSAVTSLLNLMCDAVLELDKQLQVVDDCPALGNFLFHDKGRKLTGSPLWRLVVKEDQERFAERLAARSVDGGLASFDMFHVKLRDSWGTVVNMEHFHVPFQGLGGEARHLVGLREQGDFDGASRGGFDNLRPASTSGDLNLSPPHASPVDAPPESSDEGVAGDLSSGCEQNVSVDPQVTSYGRSNVATRSDVAQDCEQSIPIEPLPRNYGRTSAVARSALEHNDKHSYQVDVLAMPSLPVTYQSQKFRKHYGTPVNLVEVLPERGEEFAEWLLQIADEVWAGTRPPHVCTFGNLTIGASRPPDSRLVMVQFVAPSAAVEDRESFMVSLRFGTKGSRSVSHSSSSGTLGTSAHSERFELRKHHTAADSSASDARISAIVEL